MNWIEVEKVETAIDTYLFKIFLKKLYVVKTLTLSSC